MKSKSKPQIIITTTDQTKHLINELRRYYYQNFINNILP